MQGLLFKNMRRLLSEAGKSPKDSKTLIHVSKGDSLLSLSIQMLISSQKMLSQAHPEILLSGHPLAQANNKLIITPEKLVNWISKYGGGKGALVRCSGSPINPSIREEKAGRAL